MSRRPAVLSIIVRVAVFTVVLWCSGTIARGDVFIEVTYGGSMPDGRTSDVVFQANQPWDVYIWGSGQDTQLNQIVFDLWTPNNGWDIYGLGAADPLGRFGTALPGSIEGNRITGVSLQARTAPFPPPPHFVPVALPQSPGSALLLYQGLGARNMTVGGLLMPEVGFVETGAGTSSTIHSFGLVETPEPASALSVLVALLIGCRRRTRWA